MRRHIKWKKCPHIIKNSTMCQKNHTLQKYNMVTFFCYFVTLSYTTFSFLQILWVRCPLVPCPRKRGFPPSSSLDSPLWACQTPFAKMSTDRNWLRFYFFVRISLLVLSGKRKGDIARPKKKTQMLSKASKHECDRKRKSQQR